jgi:aldehyde oxidoreductase
VLKKKLVINSVAMTLLVDPEASLVDVIRGQLHMTGTKKGCEKAQCGVCNVIMNGKLIFACVTKMKKVPDDARITTIEGIGTPASPHPLQLAYAKHGAVQCGFCSPGFILSTVALLESNPNPTREEVRDWFQSHRNLCRCTGYRQIVDAVMEGARVMRGEASVEELKFIVEDNKIYGTEYPRPTAIPKATGTIDYGADLALKLPAGALHLKLVQAQVHHANILSIDTTEAEKMPGVYKVITHKDVLGTNRIAFPWPGSKCDGTDRPILNDTKVFQYGDVLAAVCADTDANAQAAAEKVKVELEVLPAYMSAPEAMASDAMEIHPGMPNVFYRQKIAKGEDTAPIMEKADCVVSIEDYVIGRQPHLPLEPDISLAYYDEEGRLCISSKAIALAVVKLMTAAGIGGDPDKMVFMQHPTTGGNFGSKFSPTSEAIVAVATMATGKPCVLQYDYYQQITYTGKRSPFFIDVKAAANKEGKLLALETNYAIDHGPYSEAGELLNWRGVQFIGAGYGIPSIRGVGYTVFTNHAWGSAFRGYGSPQCFFAMESLMDILAEKLGVDPLELRYKNVYRPGDTTPTGQAPEVYTLPDLIDMIRPKYQAALAEAKKLSTPEKKRGVGVSIGIYGSGLDGPDIGTAWAELVPDGVQIYCCWHEHGQGADMGVLACAHESLRPMGITPDQIKLVMNDLSVAPDSGATAGSRSHFIVGNAINHACVQLMAALKKPDGAYMTYDEARAGGVQLKYVGTYTPPCTYLDENGQGEPFANYMYCAILAQVEVDTGTGEVQVVKMDAAVDIGKLGNKLVVDGQFFGGLAQGIGLALTEDFDDYKKHTTIRSCGIPNIKDVPDALEVIYLETPRPASAFGSSGAGEVTLTAPHAAIANAIYHACGVRIQALPALPEKILAGLKGEKYLYRHRDVKDPAY